MHYPDIGMAVGHRGERRHAYKYGIRCRGAWPVPSEGEVSKCCSDVAVAEISAPGMYVHIGTIWQ